MFVCMALPSFAMSQSIQPVRNTPGSDQAKPLQHGEIGFKRECFQGLDRPFARMKTPDKHSRLLSTGNPCPLALTPNCLCRASIYSGLATARLSVHWLCRARSSPSNTALTWSRQSCCRIVRFGTRAKLINWSSSIIRQRSFGCWISYNRAILLGPLYSSSRHSSTQYTAGIA